MKKQIIILTLIILSCSSDNKTSLKEQFKFLTPKFESVVKIDFSKSGIDLIEDFENQIKQKFCESGSHITGVITKNKEELFFPLTIYKYCNVLAHFRNRIYVTVNSKNEVLIDQEFIVKTSENLEEKLIKATKRLIEIEKKKTVVYLMEWDTKIGSIEITDRFIEIFTASKTILNNLSLEKYKKRIDNLTELELTELKKTYNPVIGIEQGFIIETE